MVVSVLAFYYDDPSSNPAENKSFFLQKCCLKRIKMNKTGPVLAH